MDGNLEAGEVLLYNKPFRWTSFDLVKKVKKMTGAKKIGHAGTLDPLATGLMILCTGKRTKEIVNYQGLEKEYEGTIVLGATTPCYDLEMEPDVFYPTQHITPEMIIEAARTFTGTIRQSPPPHSAVKIGGRRAYEMARKGQSPVMREREVEISKFQIIAIELPRIEFKVVCGKGTYIRSLAHDFGKALGSGAHLGRLVRTRIGGFALESAFTPTGF